MSFKESNKWQLVNNFTLRDGDRLHTCVPQMLILKLTHIGARYSLTRELAASEGEAAPQQLGREIVGSGDFDNADISVFSIDSGHLGHTGSVKFRILPGDPERMKKVDMVSQVVGYEYTGYSAKPVPDDGLMGPEGGVLTVVHDPESNPAWVFDLALFMPVEHFDVLFNAIATGPTPPSNAWLRMRANLFETEVDAALNEGHRSFGFMVESGDTTWANTTAMLDDLGFSFAPTGWLP